MSSRAKGTLPLLVLLLVLLLVPLLLVPLLLLLLLRLLRMMVCGGVLAPAWGTRNTVVRVVGLAVPV